jgi:phage recombination protein Bet
MNQVAKVDKNDIKLSDATGFSTEQIGVIKNTIAKGTTNTELALFLFTAKSIGLNPLNKEIWCYKDHKGNMLTFAGRDGFLTKAQQNVRYKGIRSSEVREKDVFSLDIANNEIKHQKEFTNPGAIIGAYCIAFVQNGEPTIEWVDFKTYDRGFGAWKSHPADMIKKVAETHALKKAFGISGLQSEHDWDFTPEKAYPIDTDDPVDMDTVNRIEALIRSSTFDDEQKAQMESEIVTLTNAKAEEMIATLHANQMSPQEKDVMNQGDIQTVLNMKENE